MGGLWGVVASRVLVLYGFCGSGSVRFMCREGTYVLSLCGTGADCSGLRQLHSRSTSAFFGGGLHDVESSCAVTGWTRFCTGAVVCFEFCSVDHVV